MENPWGWIGWTSFFFDDSEILQLRLEGDRSPFSVL